MEDIYSRIKQVLADHQPAALCIVVETKGSTPRKAGAKMIVFGDGSITGTIGGGNIELTVIGEALEVIRNCQPKLLSYNLGPDLGMTCNGMAVVYIEPIVGSCPLYLFGAGHVNKALYKYASDFGFNVTLFDEREGIEQTPEYKNANIVVKPFTNSIDEASFDNRTFIVIATPGHATDKTVLTACAGKPHAYLGMIGSKSKVATMKKNMLASGNFTEEDLNGIHMPIGIPFATVTAEEIAISILAQLIDCKNSIF
jgi:xanthine dehydrogenase accessory factor